MTYFREHERLSWLHWPKLAFLSIEIFRRVEIIILKNNYSEFFSQLNREIKINLKAAINIMLIYLLFKESISLYKKKCFSVFIYET